MSTPFLLTVVVGTMACVTVVTYFDHHGDKDDDNDYTLTLIKVMLEWWWNGELEDNENKEDGEDEKI